MTSTGTLHEQFLVKCSQTYLHVHRHAYGLLRMQSKLMELMPTLTETYKIGFRMLYPCAVPQSLYIYVQLTTKRLTEFSPFKQILYSGLSCTARLYTYIHMRRSIAPCPGDAE